MVSSVRDITKWSTINEFNSLFKPTLNDILIRIQVGKGIICFVWHKFSENLDLVLNDEPNNIAYKNVNTVGKINCRECSECYFGQTRRYFKSGLHERYKEIEHL